MTTNTFLEKHITVVATAITELQKQIVNPPSTNWLQKITGSFKWVSDQRLDSGFKIIDLLSILNRSPGRFLRSYDRPRRQSHNQPKLA